ncbi:phage tail protein [Halorhodospira sp. 9622]|uniref:phage tail protein n=1 Tax=Halorhodospira sp. 9622 TaxID=2899136 RepID=UPI001EE82BBD|nr:phage tail protein [Halorhodospira sp. 9622]MCG5538947.1 phage tail protein [Halorhodospira sp. 9622]
MEISGQLEDLEEVFGAELIETARVSATNRTLTKLRTAANREVRRAYNLRARDVRKAMRIVRAGRGQSAGFLIVEGPRVPLNAFGARQTRRGVTVRVRKGSGRRLVRGAFKARMPSGHEGVFVRRRQGGQRARRLPIDERYSLSVAQMLRAEGVLGTVLEQADAEYRRQLADQLRYRVEKRLGRFDRR